MVDCVWNLKIRVPFFVHFLRSRNIQFQRDNRLPEIRGVIRGVSSNGPSKLPTLSFSERSEGVLCGLFPQIHAFQRFRGAAVEREYPHPGRSKVSYSKFKLLSSKSPFCAILSAKQGLLLQSLRRASTPGAVQPSFTSTPSRKKSIKTPWRLQVMSRWGRLPRQILSLST
jgi:hypothetical protein